MYEFPFAEVQELPGEQSSAFMKELNVHIYEMVLSSDNSEKKGGILGIGESFCAENGYCDYREI